MFWGGVSRQNIATIGAMYQDTRQSIGAIGVIRAGKACCNLDGPGAKRWPGALPEHTRRYIEAALGRCHGRVDGPFGAARLLEMYPNTLRSKMRRLGIVPGKFRGA